jgi:PPK2 family polyphosphate:nucleotide phosphotransferase
MSFDIDALLVRPGTKLDLSDIDPQATPEYSGDKESSVARIAELNRRLEELQELLYAEGKHRVLVVLQAMDAGGKDGTIRKVFDGVNPSGVKAPSFKKPTEPELARDYLWRVHPHVPADGELVIFNRSHYEDVLVVRVLDLVEKDRWRKRYRHIVEFERMLADEGTTIVKIYLHISKDEQRERLQARLEEPAKNWKFEKGDLAMRERWGDFMAAFEEALEETSTEHAPWYVVPANRKWYRNVAVLEIMVQTLESLNMSFPPADPDIATITIPE